MSRKAQQTLLAVYEKTAREFAGRVRQRFGEAVHSVVLYGSVAQQTAHEDSDIDVLVLTDDGEAWRGELADLSESVDFEHHFETFLIPTCLTPERLQELRAGGFPIARHVLTEGVVLYDDGTFERIREDALAVGQRDAGRR